MSVDNSNRTKDDNKGDEKYKVVYSVDCVGLDGSSPAIIDVSEPVIVRPGFNYKIRFDLGPFDEEPFCTTFRLMTNEVQIQTGITVKFSLDETRHGANRGVICGLAFSKL